MAAEIRTFTCLSDNFGYLIHDPATKATASIDAPEAGPIIKALERTGGQRTLAAEQLGISRRTLSRKLKEYNINFAPGDKSASLSTISNEQQKFYRARVSIAVRLRNSQGEELQGIRPHP